jgi:hypothetical protein
MMLFNWIWRHPKFAGQNSTVNSGIETVVSVPNLESVMRGTGKRIHSRDEDTKS